MPTHGSLSEAGKDRMQTPKSLLTVKKSLAGPRVNSRKLYHKRVEVCRNIG